MERQSDMKSDLPGQGRSVDPVTMIEAERAKTKAEWAGRSPEEREEAVRLRLEDLYRAMGMSKEEIERMHEGSYDDVRAEWEKEWQDKKEGGIAGGKR